MMAAVINYISLRNKISAIADSAGYSHGTPIVQESLRNEHIRRAIQLAALELPTLGYDVTPVLDITLLQTDGNYYRSVRTAIRRSIQITERLEEEFFNREEPTIEEY